MQSDDGIKLPLHYALVFGCVTVFIVSSWLLVWLRIRFLQRRAELAASEQMHASRGAGLQPATTCNCCPCASAAAPVAVLVQTPDERYFVGVQLSAHDVQT